MKKFLFLLILCVAVTVAVSSTSSNKSPQYFKTIAYAEAHVSNGTYVWGSLQKSDIALSIDISKGFITIYSPITQVYRITGFENFGKIYIDQDRYKNIMLNVVDQDGDKGKLRLRYESNGNSQVYIYFSNVAWLYHVVRTTEKN